jgi:putative MATE family efflux protein
MFVGVGEQIVDLTSTVLLARYGIVELGAVGLADTIYEMLIVLIIGLVDGLQIVLARRAGERSDAAIGETFNQGVLLLLALSAAIIGVIAVGAHTFCVALFSSPDVASAVADFLFYLSLGLPFQAVGLAYCALFLALSRTRALVGATLILVLTNLALDYSLIYGRFGFPELGIRGAALGAAGAEAAACLYLTVYTLRRVDIKRFGLFRFRGWSGRLIRSLMGISSPVVLQAFLEGMRWFAFFVIIEQLGERPLALANIVYAIYAVFLIPSQSFAETACSMVSHVIGRGQPGRIATVMRSVLLPGYLLTLPAAALVLAFPRAVLAVFSSDAALVEGCVGGLRVVAATILVAVPGEMWAAAVMGTGDTKASFAIELLLCMVMLSCAYGAAQVLGLSLTFIWVSLPLGWLVGLGASVAWVKSEHWKRLQI